MLVVKCGGVGFSKDRNTWGALDLATSRFYPK
jgi:hypothetical protein